MFLLFQATSLRKDKTFRFCAALYFGELYIFILKLVMTRPEHKAVYLSS